MHSCWALALCAAFALSARAGTLTLEAFDPQGGRLSGRQLLERIAPVSRKSSITPETSAILVTDLDDAPAGGRPWLLLRGKEAVLSWQGPSRVRLSLPWPVAEDGFSTILLDNGGQGYPDGARVLVSEAAAETEYRLFKESLAERTASWEPNYKPSAKALALQDAARSAMEKAKRQEQSAKRSALFDKALTEISSAWSKMLFEHGTQAAADPKTGPALRWGLTLDESLANRVDQFDKIAKRVESSGANWVRLVFRMNAEDYTYSKPRSFTEYDAAVAALAARKIHIMGSPLDSTMWPRSMEPRLAAARTRNLVLHYRDSIRSWEVASEINGNWLGGVRHPLPEDLILRSVREAAAEVKSIDPALETVATLYWWEGTAMDDVHPTFAWLRRMAPEGVFRQFDVVALSVYPDENPMGLAFDTAFRKLHRYLPNKRLMLGAFGYVEGSKLEGYWWLDPTDIDGARKDLVILYVAAAAAAPNPLGGGFWWPTLNTMMPDARGGDSLVKIYRRTLDRLGR
ncbi:MAG: hypothetical protein NTX64_00885 [Elusimicrobia bacterium]|nr:hypothetical protein [Elusimicrobiota bacterium]